MADLLDKLGGKEPKQAAGKSSEAPAGEAIVGTNSTSDQLRRGNNLLDLAAKNDEQKTSETSETVVETKETKTVADPDSWSKDSALKEVVKLREEAKAVRLKFQEQLEKVQAETDAKIAKIKEEAESANEAKKKLEALEAEQADKKRSIEDKLANREARLAETEAVYKSKLEAAQKEAEGYKAKAIQYEAEQEARKQVYRERIKEELDKVPQDFRDFAEKMVKGYDDPHEAWLAISEAHRKNMFGEKKVIVNHSVPGAADGARLSKTKLEEQEAANKAKKTPRDLIKSGLAKIKQGEANSAFRSR